jgi:hypothetical protein
MERKQFDNGINICTTIECLYHSVPDALRDSWGDPVRTASANTFFHWLNAPSSDRWRGDPPLTNLAVYIYDSRRDLQDEHPGLNPKNRVDYVRWFLAHAQREHELDSVFIRSLRDLYMKWAKAPCAQDPLGRNGVPIITNFGAWMYSFRRELQSRFPDLYGEHRVDFAVWFAHSTRIEEKDGVELVLPVVTSWAKACLPVTNAVLASGHD